MYSPQKARYLILTASRLTAVDAKSIGIIDEVYPEDILNKKVKSLLKTLFRAAPLAVAETKNFTHELWGKDIQTGSDLAQKKLFEMISNPETLSGISAFNEGNIPEWFGKFKSKNEILYHHPELVCLHFL